MPAIFRPKEKIILDRQSKLLYNTFMKSRNTLQKISNFLFGGALMATTTQASVRVPNYTDAMVARLVGEYTSTPTRATVDALANEMGKNPRSIIAKLVREGVYQAQERTTKSGAPIVRKAELVSEISSLTGTSVDSLVKASKADLERLVAALNAILPSVS
tara:strand:- start:104 stop:583 length:480 start_codon:yes stop_codon:yes gene_type:complete